MRTSRITAALPAQDVGRAKAFYAEKIGLQAFESGSLEARDGQVGLTVGDGVNQMFVYPAQVRSSGEFTQGGVVQGLRRKPGRPRASLSRTTKNNPAADSAFQTGVGDASP
jgi:hypothetical protein